MKKLIKDTVKWMKQIPVKTEIVLNNLWIVSSTFAELGIGVYLILEVSHTLSGYAAIASLVASIVIAVDGGVRLLHFLVKAGK